MNIEALKLEYKNLLQQQQELLDDAEDADRDLTSSEESEFKKLERRSNVLKIQIEDLELNGRSTIGIGRYAALAPGQTARSDGTVEYRGATGNRYAVNDTPELVECFNRFLISGERALSSVERRTFIENRALQADLDVDGGFLVPQVYLDQVIQGLDDFVFIRNLATKFLMRTGESIGAPTLDSDPADPEWTAEIKTGTEDDEMRFGKREFYPHPLAKRVKISKRLLRVSSIDVAGLVRERLVYKAGTVLENAYMNGTGQNSPLGIFVDSEFGITNGRDRETGTAATVKADDLIDAVSDLKNAIQARQCVGRKPGV